VKQVVVLLLLFWMGAIGLKAEPLEYFLSKDVSYDQSVVKPVKVLGHDIGDQPIRHDLMVEYIRQLAVGSPRMAVETIGYSHEQRPILFITVTSPENHARLNDIRQNHLLRVNPKTSGKADDDMPVVTWLNYGVHGAEASGMDAAVPVLYHLAAAQGDDVQQQLQESVILITAIFNPDGHSRRISWQNQNGSDVRATDPTHEIHNPQWPGGRTNHYWFDLNRQWLLQTQPESKAWLSKWHEWKPQVSADFHEMGPNSTYYFHPGVASRKHPLIPAEGRQLLQEMAGHHAAWMDSENKLYYSEEDFDNYYVGKGSTYPQINGSLGILFEAGAQMGVARESKQGLKTFAENIQMHTGTSLSTIRGAVALRSKLHTYQRQFFETAAESAAEDDVTAYVFQAPEDPVRLGMFVDLLNRHDIRVYSTKGKLKSGNVSYGADSYIVPMTQPQYRMARAIFERITEFPDKVFYDVSGWTLPLAYGLEYTALTSNITSRLGERVEDVNLQKQEPDVSAYGYIFRWSDYYAPKVLNELLAQGIMARVIKKPIRVATSRGVVALNRGAVFVQKHRQTVNGQSIDRLMKTLAVENQLTIHAVTSGRTAEGPDLGGRTSVHDLQAPKPLLVVGDGVTPYDAGEVWHLLDHRMKIPVTLVRKDRLKKVDLNQYTHLVLVGGSGSKLPVAMVDDVKAWIKKGGTLVAHRHGARWVSDKMLDRKLDKAETTVVVGRQLYKEKQQSDAQDVIGGALVESILDLSHPMAFGLVRDRVATNRNTSFVLKEPKDPYARVAVYSKDLLLSGYVSDARQNGLQKTPMMTAERKGDGAVILFADNPNFRATYPAAEKLFLNALFFSTAFNKARSSDEATSAMEE